MKDLSKLIIRIIAIASAGIPTAAAQETQQYDFSTIRINGLEVDKAYTREQIIDALGEPSIEDEYGYYYFTYISTYRTRCCRQMRNTRQARPCLPECQSPYWKTGPR